MRHIGILLGLVATACNVTTNINTNTGDDGGSNTNAVPDAGHPSGGVTANMTPVAKSPAPTASTTIVVIIASGIPSGMSSAPSAMSMMPADGGMGTVSSSVTGLIGDAYNASATCDSYGLSDGQGYCGYGDTADDTFLVFCSAGAVYEFDCSTLDSNGSSVGCGYGGEIDNISVECVDAAAHQISPDVADDSADAYPMDWPCSAFEEGSAYCGDGDYAYYCKDGSQYAQDCAEYAADGEQASCGIDPTTNNIDCVFGEADGG